MKWWWNGFALQLGRSVEDSASTSIMSVKCSVLVRVHCKATQIRRDKQPFFVTRKLSVRKCTQELEATKKNRVRLFAHGSCTLKPVPLPAYSILFQTNTQLIVRTVDKRFELEEEEGLLHSKALIELMRGIARSLPARVQPCIPAGSAQNAFLEKKNKTADGVVCEHACVKALINTLPCADGPHPARLSCSLSFTPPSSSPSSPSFECRRSLCTLARRY